VLLAFSTSDESLQISQDVASVRTRLHGPDDPETLAAMHIVIQAMRAVNTEGVVTLGLDQVPRMHRVLGPTHPATISSAQALGETLTKSGRYEEALPLLRDAYQANVNRQGTTSPHTIMFRHSLLECLLKIADTAAGTAEAKPLLEEQRQAVETTFGVESYMGAIVISQQYRIAKLENDEARAEEYAAKLRGTQYEGMLTGVLTGKDPHGSSRNTSHGTSQGAPANEAHNPRR
jgi:Tetratricopeptide repeat